MMADKLEVLLTALLASLRAVVDRWPTRPVSSDGSRERDVVIGFMT
jgi:hypothetical protein